ECAGIGPDVGQPHEDGRGPHGDGAQDQAGESHHAPRLGSGGDSCRQCLLLQSRRAQQSQWLRLLCRNRKIADGNAKGDGSCPYGVAEGSFCPMAAPARLSYLSGNYTGLPPWISTKKTALSSRPPCSAAWSSTCARAPTCRTST